MSLSLEQTETENQVNEAFGVRVVEKTWKIDTKVFWKKEFDGQWYRVRK